MTVGMTQPGSPMPPAWFGSSLPMSLASHSKMSGGVAYLFFDSSSASQRLASSFGGSRGGLIAPPPDQGCSSACPARIRSTSRASLRIRASTYSSASTPAMNGVVRTPVRIETSPWSTASTAK